MWYFSVKQSVQFIEPGEYGLALSKILHSSDTSMILLFWSNIKLYNSVAFPLCSYLKEILSLFSLCQKKTLCKSDVMGMVFIRILVPWD